MSNVSEKATVAQSLNSEETNEDSEDLRRSSRRKRARVSQFLFCLRFRVGIGSEKHFVYVLYLFTYVLGGSERNGN